MSRSDAAGAIPESAPTEGAAIVAGANASTTPPTEGARKGDEMDELLNALGFLNLSAADLACEECEGFHQTAACPMRRCAQCGVMGAHGLNKSACRGVVPGVRRIGSLTSSR